MDRIKKATLSVALFSCLSFSTVHAASFYAGASIGGAKTDIDTAEIDRDLAAEGFTSSTSADESATGFKLFGGYKVNDNFSFEGGFVDLGEYTTDTDLSGPATGQATSETELDGFFLSAVAGYPVADDISLFAKAGLFFWDAKVNTVADLGMGSVADSASDDGTDFTFGLGVSYDFGNASLRLDWDRYLLKGDTDLDTDMFSVGLQVNF